MEPFSGNVNSILFQSWFPELGLNHISESNFYIGILEKKLKTHPHKNYKASIAETCVEPCLGDVNWSLFKNDSMDMVESQPRGGGGGVKGLYAG